MPHKPITLFSLLIVFAFSGNTLLAQATFTATVFPNVIGKNETAELRLMFENAAAVNVDQPSLKDFIIVSGPTQKSFPEMDYNGITHSYAGIAYIIKPKRTGTFTIAAATAKLDGKTVKSNPVVLKVVAEINRNNIIEQENSNEPQQPGDYNGFILKKGENVQDKISKNLFIRVLTDKTSCYVGEHLTVTYKLYSRLNSVSKIIKRSAFNGFSVIDLQPEESGSTNKIEKLEGRDYYVYILRRAQLYPQQAGAAQLEPVLVENYIRLIKAEFAQQLKEDAPPEILPGVNRADAIIDTSIIAASKPVSIMVKELPVAGKPVSFKGAVGSFMLDAFVEKDSLTTNDAGNLKILLSGEGNMTLVAAPEVVWPSGLEGYAPAVKNGLNNMTVPVSGSEIFDYVFTASREGDYTIPPVELSFFEVATGKYKTVSTKSFAVHVSKGTSKRSVMAADTAIRRETISETIFTHRWMIVLPVALLIMLGLLLWLRVDKKREKEKSIAAMQRQPVTETTIEESIPINPLEQTEIMLVQNEPRKFYETIDKELHVFLAGKLKLPAEAISKKAIADGLDKKGVGISDSIAIQKLLDDISMQLYTPFADENKMQDCYVEAVRLVNKVGAL